LNQADFEKLRLYKLGKTLYEKPTTKEGVLGTVGGAAAGMALGGPLGAAIGGLLSPGKNLASKIAGAALEYGRNALTTAAGIAGDAISPGLGAQAQNATNQGLGVATNPNMSLTFNGVDLRNHNFTWRLIAKSIQESLEIENIINTLKLNALPRKIVGAGFTLSYPAIAMLSFFPTNLIKISDLGCFITSINVKYDGDGYPVFFKGEKPVIVDLSISFRERAILTSDDYYDYASDAIHPAGDPTKGKFIQPPIGG
jgi:hypothetical protein